MRRSSAFPVILVGALAFGGCASTADASADVEGNAPSPTAATPPASGATAIDCDALLPLSLVKERVGTNFEATSIGDDDFAGLSSPLEAEALESATYITGCYWEAQNSDEGFKVILLSIEPIQEEALGEALQSSTAFDTREDPSPSRPGEEAIAFSRNGGDGKSGGFAHGFEGGYWSIVSGDILTADTATFLSTEALAAAHAAR